MGKAEGSVAREEWHGHVTALSVAPEFRRLGLAAKLMEMLEEISERFVPSQIIHTHAHSGKKGSSITIKKKQLWLIIRKVKICKYCSKKWISIKTFYFKI